MERPTVPFQTLTLGLTVPKITSSNQSKGGGLSPPSGLTAGGTVVQSIHKDQSSAVQSMQGWKVKVGSLL